MLLGHYTKRRPLWDEISEVIRVIFMLSVIDATVLYLTKLQFSRFWFLGIWMLAVFLVPVWRMLARNWLKSMGIWQLPVFILGTGKNALDAMKALYSQPEMGLNVIAFIQPCKETSDEEETVYLDYNKERYPIHFMPEESIIRMVSQFDHPIIIVALEEDGFLEKTKLIIKLSKFCDDLRVIPPVRGLPLFGATIEHFFRHEIFFLSLKNNLSKPGLRFIKRLVDIVLSFLLIVVLSPAFLFLSWIIKKDGGPAFFLHKRIGRNGSTFNCIKFRTMINGSEKILKDILESDPSVKDSWEKDFKLKDDPRTTKIGHYLRKYSLDELPQLFNILLGEMSLVGPRPIVEEEIEKYSDSISFYLEIRPGMTGLWQVSGRNDTDYEYRVYLDSWYVKNWSLWYDFIILVKTIRVVLKREGAY